MGSGIRSGFPLQGPYGELGAEEPRRNRTAGGLRWQVQEGEEHGAVRDFPGSLCLSVSSPPSVSLTCPSSSSHTTDGEYSLGFCPTPAALLILHDLLSVPTTVQV